MPSLRAYEELMELEEIPFMETPGNEVISKNAFKKTVDRCQAIHVQREYSMKVMNIETYVEQGSEKSQDQSGSVMTTDY